VVVCVGARIVQCSAISCSTHASSAAAAALHNKTQLR